MFATVKGLFQIWDDVTKRIPLYNTGDDKLLQIAVDGYQEYNAGKARLAYDTAIFTIPRGTVAELRAWYLRVEGAPGVNVTITKTVAAGGQSIVRQVRPFDSTASADAATPVGLVLETVDDVATIQIQHPTPGNAQAEPVMVHYALIGDAEA